MGEQEALQAPMAGVALAVAAVSEQMVEVAEQEAVPMEILASAEVRDPLAQIPVMDLMDLMGIAVRMVAAAVRDLWA